MTLTVGSLCSGIGGFELAAGAVGWRTLFVSEIEPYPSQILAHHFPDVPNIGDFTTFDWSTVERPDILCAGWPCQPHSVAGKREGSGDKRDLWPFVWRAVRELRPRYFVGENVPGLLASDGGRFFNRVVSDLAEIGYVGEWGTLSAAQLGAPHKRERLWLVAYAPEPRPAGRQNAGTGSGDAGKNGRRRLELERGRSGVVAYAPESGLSERDSTGQPEGVTEGRGRLDGGPERHRSSVGDSLRDWSDAIPHRGADGTVRLIPRGAVANRGHSEPPRAGGDAQPVGAEHAGGADSHELRRGQEEVAGTEPEVRPLAHGLPHGLAGHSAGEESTSLWPVTENEPGRVARLKAVGNAVVPLWVVHGPFRRVIEHETAT